MKRTIIAVGVVLGMAASLQADVVEFSIYENEDNIDVSGLLLTVELIDTGSGIDFVFRNQSTASSVITAVYFENTNAIDGMMLNGGVGAESGGVDFGDGATPADPAQHLYWVGGAWDTTNYAAGAMSPEFHNGVNELGDESLTIGFDYGGGADYNTIANALMSDPGLFRIAMHIQGVGAGGEFSVWGTTAPAPASASLLVIGGILATRRRR